ncbi:DNA topoisomerase III [Geosporobacter ferrireducens]|uniref:DNA topoisomerase n=1 Tax=Geosporobacter ferrireducens TaxID=1424294 RepID=A0A1D8GFQ8_9FIRM|nr:DNA topoisomerase III [Geosporobacter ferrireducens]AOT69744.1 DNA topoisomerase III [Geosporobacter ferrireducens]
MKKLVIAEKPSVARDIAKVLGAKTKGEGYLEGNGYVVTWAIGHLVALCDPEEYDLKYKRWDMRTLPVIPEEMKLKPIKRTYQQYKIIKTLLADKDVSMLICATDAGREGELIFRYIYSLARCSKPVKRLWISSLTDEAIKEGFENLKDGKDYDALYLSAKCRSESDWLVGINATRAYTVKYNSLLTIGRVQTPTLAILVKREKEIEAFIPQAYWELNGDFGSYKGIWIDKENKESRIDSREKAEALAKKVLNQSGFVKDIESKKIVKKPPLLYDLTELQRDANKRYGYTAERTLTIAQGLYEKRKVITYPRTDSKYLSKDLIKGLQKKIENLRDGQYKEFCEYLLKLEKLPISKKIVDDSKVSDHHAIIPTDKKADVSKFSQEEKNIFYLIAQRFLSVFFPDYIYNSTTVISEVMEEWFKTTGQQIMQLGWQSLYRDEDGCKDNIPKVMKGQEILVKGTSIEDKQTQPPKRYTEAALLSAMENAGKFIEDEDLREQLKESGIGTPATRASIIERLIEVGYVLREGKNLIPTEKGKNLIAIVPEELSSPELTGKWERALNRIAKGKMDEKRFMEGIGRFTAFLVKDAYERETRIAFERERKKTGRKGSQAAASATAQEKLGICPACKVGEILEGSKNFYCSNYKQGCKFGLFKQDKLMARYRKKMSKTIVKQLIQKGEALLKGVVSPKGGKFDAKIKLKQLESGYWGWSFDFEKQEKQT